MVVRSGDGKPSGGVGGLKVGKWEDKSEIMLTFTYGVRAVRKMRRFSCQHFWNGQYPMQFLDAISRFLNIWKSGIFSF